MILSGGGVGVGVGYGPPQYPSPVFVNGLPASPPQTIISLPVRLPCDKIGQRARRWCWWLSNYPCRDCIWRQYSSRCLRPRRSFHCQSRPQCDTLGKRARWSSWWLSNYSHWDCISYYRGSVNAASQPSDLCVLFTNPQRSPVTIEFPRDGIVTSILPQPHYPTE